MKETKLQEEKTDIAALVITFILATLLVLGPLNIIAYFACHGVTTLRPIMCDSFLVILK